MEQFEYMTKKLLIVDNGEVTIFNNEEINRLGENGWELIQVFPRQNKGYFGIFKRRI